VTTLRIYDLKNHVLALDLRDLLRLLAPQSLQATWTISTIKSADGIHEWFDATGEGGEQLERLVENDATLPGYELAALAKKTSQVIWGEFNGSLPSKSKGIWITIRAIDSTFYEITTDDAAAIKKIRSTFKDIRSVDGPTTDCFS
jgi:hypothetical protein